MENGYEFSAERKKIKMEDNSEESEHIGNLTQTVT